MITLRAFDNSDWCGLAGAERGPDGTEPHINATEVLLDGEAVIVVADAEGVQIITDRQGHFTFVMKNIHAAIAFAGALPVELDAVFLIKHGFTHL